MSEWNLESIRNVCTRRANGSISIATTAKQYFFHGFKHKDSDLHPYKPREETVARVWKKSDYISFVFSICSDHADGALQICKNFIKDESLRSILPSETSRSNICLGHFICVVDLSID